MPLPGRRDPPRLRARVVGYRCGMEIVAIVIIVVALLAAGWIVAARLRVRAHGLRIRRDKLESVAAGHREMIAAHEVAAEELQPQAPVHRDAAARHTRRAEELEARIELLRRQAQLHEERAADTRRERERI